MFDAIYSKDISKLEEKLKSGVSPNSLDERKRTVLATASAIGFVEGIKVLIEAGADINKANEDDLGYTPLIEACREGQIEAVKVLIDKGANLEAGDSVKKTPFINAVIAAHKVIIEFLLQKGADINGADERGQTALHYICRYAKSWCSMVITQTINGVSKQMPNNRFVEFTEVLKYLIKVGADVNKLTNYGYSAMHLCADSNSFEFVPMLVKAGADVNFKNAKGYAPIHAGADKGSVKACKALLENGADVNAVDEFGFSPLISAVNAGNVDLVKMFLDKGANKTLKAKTAYGSVQVGDTASDTAKRKGIAELVALLQ